MKSSAIPEVTPMFMKQVKLVLLLIFLCFWIEGLSQNKGEALSAGFTKLKKNITLQLSNSDNQRFLKKEPTYIGGNFQTRLMILLAGFDDSAYRLFLGRMKSLTKESVDLWSHTLSEKSEEDIQNDMIILGFPRLKFLFNDSLYIKSAEENFII
jgi:hypothetical protein